jgi:hypothetical protein
MYSKGLGSTELAMHSKRGNFDPVGCNLGTRRAPEGQHLPRRV